MLECQDVIIKLHIENLKNHFHKKIYAYQFMIIHLNKLQTKVLKRVHQSR